MNVTVSPTLDEPDEAVRVVCVVALATDCVRAPAMGAYASAPYKEPPCMPKTAN